MKDFLSFFKTKDGLITFIACGLFYSILFMLMQILFLGCKVANGDIIIP